MSQKFPGIQCIQIAFLLASLFFLRCHVHMIFFLEANYHQMEILRWERHKTNVMNVHAIRSRFIQNKSKFEVHGN